MSTLIGVIVGLGSFLGYGLTAAYVGARAYHGMFRRQIFEPGMPAFMAGLLWPIGIFALLAWVLFSRLEAKEKAIAEAERERRQYLEAAARELEKIDPLYRSRGR